MSALQPPDTAPLGVNVTVLASDNRREQWIPDCKRFFTLGTPRFIGVPDGWHVRGWIDPTATAETPAGEPPSRS